TGAATAAAILGCCAAPAPRRQGLEPRTRGLRAQTGQCRPVPCAANRCRRLTVRPALPAPSAVAPCRAMSARTGTVDHTSPVPHWSRTTRRSRSPKPATRSTWQHWTTRVIEMTKKTAAGWHAYDEVSELLTELDLTTDDMTRARETTDDHVRAWHLARVRT